MKALKVISVLAFMLASGIAFAVAPGQISVVSVSGDVAFVMPNKESKALIAGDLFAEKTRVVTTKDSSTKIVLGNGTVIAVEPNSEIIISDFDQNNPDAVAGQDFTSFKSEPEATSGSLTTVRLVKGTATFNVAKLLASSKFTVKTRGGDVIVKGTSFSVADDGSHVSVTVAEGVVSVAATNHGAISVSGGRAVAISVSPNGAVGAPALRPASSAEVAAIAAAVETGGRVSGRSDATAQGGSDIGVDPELPSFANGDVAGADHGYLKPETSDTNSPSSL